MNTTRRTQLPGQQAADDVPDPEKVRRSPEHKELTAAVQKWTAEFTSVDLNVEDDTEYQYLATLSKRGTEFVRAYKLMWDKPRKLADQLKKSILSTLSMLTDPIESGVVKIDRALIDYTRKKRQLVEADRLKRQAAAQSQHDDLYLNSAESLASAGDVQGAQQVLEAGVNTHPVVPVESSAPPKVEGISERHSGWEFTITDGTKLPVEYTTLDWRDDRDRELIEKRLRKVIDVLGPKANIAGVTVGEPRTSLVKRRG